MIRSAICFAALLFVIASAWYLPEWVAHYQTKLAQVQR